MRWKDITKQGDGSWIGYRANLGPLELTVSCETNAVKGGKWDATAGFKQGYEYIDMFWLKGFSSQMAAQKAIVKHCRTVFLKIAKALKAAAK